MDSTVEQVIIGIITLLIGLFVVVSGSFSFDFGSVSFLVMGAAFILLYRTKRKSWSLVLGVYLMYFGFSGAIIETVSNGAFSDRVITFLASGMLFLVTGAVFLILFYDKNRRGLLIPGMVFVCISIDSFFRIVLLSAQRDIIYFIFAFCAYTVYRQGYYFTGRWPKYVAFVLLIIGFTRLLH